MMRVTSLLLVSVVASLAAAAPAPELVQKGGRALETLAPSPPPSPNAPAVVSLFTVFAQFYIIGQVVQWFQTLNILAKSAVLYVLGFLYTTYMPPSAPPGAPPPPPHSPPPPLPPGAPPPSPPSLPMDYPAVVDIGVPAEMFAIKCLDSSIGVPIANQFHQNCLNKPIVVVIESTTGNVFGGYTGIGSFNGNNGIYQAAPGGFLFIINDGTTTNFVARQTPIAPGYALYNNAGYGPCFGGNHDLCIHSPSSSSYQGFSYLGYSYWTPAGTRSPPYYIGGSRYFNIQSLQVYHAE